MHNSIYDHDGNEAHYKHYISEICYRLGFEIVREDGPALDVMWKIQDGEKKKILDSDERPRNALWFYAWKSLLDEYSLHDTCWAYGRKS